jgi:hypothetical protein
MPVLGGKTLIPRVTVPDKDVARKWGRFSTGNQESASYTNAGIPTDKDQARSKPFLWLAWRSVLALLALRSTQLVDQTRQNTPGD